MVKVISGLTPEGTKCIYYLDGYIKENLDRIKLWVTKKQYDYVGIVCGLPGTGKSNFSQGIARYCDENFDHTHIAFTDDDFIKITNECPEYSAVVLDESFQSLNARVTNSTAFLRIINHIQLIRQKHLFIFLCLPNFFDLSKTVAIYRASHLFMVYSDDEGNRGSVAVFDRNAKRELYIKGGKFMDYNCVDANFVAKFVKQKGVDEKKYEAMKRKHLLEQERTIVKVGSISKKQRDKYIEHLINVEKWTKKKVAEIGGISQKTIYNILNKI